MNNDSFIKKLSSFITGLSLRVIVLSIMVLVVFIAVSYSYNFGHSVFFQQPAEEAPGTDIVVEIDNEMTVDDLASLLKEEGIIDNELAFVDQTKLYKAKIWPGSYILNTSMTTKEIIQLINSAEYEITKAPEGGDTSSGIEIIGGGGDGD